MTIVSMHCKQQAESLTFVWSVVEWMSGGRDFQPDRWTVMDQCTRGLEFLNSLCKSLDWQYVKDTHVREELVHDSAVLSLCYHHHCCAYTELSMFPVPALLHRCLSTSLVNCSRMANVQILFQNVIRPLSPPPPFNSTCN